MDGLGILSNTIIREDSGLSLLAKKKNVDDQNLFICSSI